MSEDLETEDQKTEDKKPAENVFLILNHPMGGVQVIDVAEGTTLTPITPEEIKFVLTLKYGESPNSRFMVQGIMFPQSIISKEKVDFEIWDPLVGWAATIAEEELMDHLEDNPSSESGEFDTNIGGVKVTITYTIKKVD